MSDLNRLIQFVHEAPAGTLIPVESLRDLLSCVSVKADEERPLTPHEAAEWLHRHVGGRKRSAAAVRKAMRTGFRGVVLSSYPYGRERRTTEADLRRFVAQIGLAPRPPAPERLAPSPRTFTPTMTEAVAPSYPDPAEEIAAAEARYGKPSTAPPGPSPRRGRSSVGA